MNSEADETQVPPQAAGTPDEAAVAEPEAPVEPEWVELPSGEALSEQEAEETMKVSPTKVVLVAGENDAGKTSLLCSVYEQYLKGDFAGYRFAGSRTLRAFEQRSFLQRAESRREQPDMERTRLPAGQTQLLHLDLQAKSSGERTALLTTDLAGEAFALIRNNPDECERYPIFGRVDCVTVLLDAERLLTNNRHAHVNSTRTTLRSMLQSQTLRPEVPIVVAVSKWDLVEGGAAQSQAREDVEAILAVARDHSTEFVRTAAAPTKAGAVAAGYGLSGLLSFWLSVETPAAEVELMLEEDGGDPPSAFDSFQADEGSS